LLADVRELVCTRIIKRINPKAVAEVWDLENDRRVIQVVEEAGPYATSWFAQAMMRWSGLI